MSDKSKIKYISDIDITDSDILVKKPFKLKTENKRRFVRVEISAPISLRNLKNKIELIEHEMTYPISGTILNISSNGVLVDIPEAVAEQDFLLMKFTIQESENIDSILGVVKRIDVDGESNIVGIEFLSPEAVKDRLSQPEIEILQENITNFHDRIYETLENFLFKN